MTQANDESFSTSNGPEEESVEENTTEITLTDTVPVMANPAEDDVSVDKNKTRDTIDLEDKGGVEELSPQERALRNMSYYVLTGTFLFMAFFSGWYILSESHLAELQSDFAAMCIDDAETTEGNVETKVGKFCSAYSQKAGDNNAAAEEVFEFMKNFLPSIITLVLGAHYVTKSNE